MSTLASVEVAAGGLARTLPLLFLPRHFFLISFHHSLFLLLSLASFHHSLHLISFLPIPLHSLLSLSLSLFRLSRLIFSPFNLSPSLPRFFPYSSFISFYPFLFPLSPFQDQILPLLYLLLIKFLISSRLHIPLLFIPSFFICYSNFLSQLKCFRTPLTIILISPHPFLLLTFNEINLNTCIHNSHSLSLPHSISFIHSFTHTHTSLSLPPFFHSPPSFSSPSSCSLPLTPLHI